MHKLFLLAGSISGMLSVMIGAFGAHALKATLEATNRLETFETAVKYQFYHSLALILLGILMVQFQNKAFNVSGYGFIVGIIIFSGSLYALSLTGITKFGAITPVGGLALILGWAALAWGIFKTV
ncbi:MAG: DUF423 domain-containing protein [Cyclobacteriaceae bacterium]|nr:DUF423 domain-containing protein [Cyclobacteriaceae bacterium]